MKRINFEQKQFVKLCSAELAKYTNVERTAHTHYFRLGVHRTKEQRTLMLTQPYVEAWVKFFMAGKSRDTMINAIAQQLDKHLSDMYTIVGGR